MAELFAVWSNEGRFTSLPSATVVRRRAERENASVLLANLGRVFENSAFGFFIAFFNQQLRFTYFSR